MAAFKRRISVEMDNISEIGYKVNENLDGSYTISRDHFEFNIVLDNYPFKPPTIKMIKPFSIGVYIDWTKWVPTHNIKNIIESTINDFAEFPEKFPKILKIPETAYLVIGSSREEHADREHYDNPNVLLMDIRKSDIEIDFLNNTHLYILSLLLPYKFDEICFDWSTLKTFKVGDTVVERLRYLKQMLKPGGKLYCESIDAAPGGGANPDERATDYSAKFIDMCREAGFTIEGNVALAKDITGSVLVPMVFKGVTRDTGIAGDTGITRDTTKITVLQKPVRGGRKKRTKRRRMKRSKKYRY